MIKKLKIPESRIPIIIGVNGSVKKCLESKTSTKIIIDENETTISGESLNVLECENVILAMGRGFSPPDAFLLLKKENIIEVIELPKEENQLKRIRSRLIGIKGKARKNMERLTGTRISIFGKTVSIIGEFEGVMRVKKAIEKLIKGFSHRIVYKFLEHPRSIR